MTKSMFRVRSNRMRLPHAAIVATDHRSALDLYLTVAKDAWPGEPHARVIGPDDIRFFEVDADGEWQEVEAYELERRMIRP